MHRGGYLPIAAGGDPRMIPDPQTTASTYAELLADQASIAYRAVTRYGFEPEQFTNWRYQMAKQVVTREDAAGYAPLSEAQQQGYDKLEPIFQSGVTPYYMVLGDAIKGEANPVRAQAIPNIAELTDSAGLADPLGEVDHSPVREVVHVYPDRVAFCVAQLCPVYCRYCFRKRRDETAGLHFNRAIIKRGIDYIKSQPAIKDVLVTGGDPFIASDESLRQLLTSLREIDHVEIIRFGTRTPVTLPYRITPELTAMLKDFHPIWLNTHFNSHLELTPDAVLAVGRLLDAGIPVGNQAVLLAGVNDTKEQMAALCRSLIRHRIRPYYVFHPHTIAGTEHLRVSAKKGLDIMTSLRGTLSGYGIPAYILDTPSGKVPLQHNYILGTDGDDLLVQTPHGEIHREVGVWF